MKVMWQMFPDTFDRQISTELRSGATHMWSLTEVLYDHQNNTYSAVKMNSNADYTVSYNCTL